MSKQYPGGFITRSPTVPTALAAPGIWTLDQAMQNIRAGTWPTPPPAQVYIATTLYSAPTSGAGFNTHTFSSVNLGSNGTTKIIAVVFDAAGVATTISSATIGGVSATVNQTLYSGSWGQVAILIATGVTATTGNIVLNFAATLNTFGGDYLATISASVYTTTRTSIDAYQSNNSTSPSVTANGNNRTNGLVIAVHYSTNGSTAPPPAINANANLTTNYNQTVPYSTGGYLDRHSAYSGVRNTSFAITTATAGFQALACITLY